MRTTTSTNHPSVNPNNNQKTTTTTTTTNTQEQPRGAAPLYCEECNRYFSSAFSRKRHIRTHTKPTTAPTAVVVAIDKKALAQVQQQQQQEEEEEVTLRIYKSPVDGTWQSAIEPARTRK